MNPFVADPEWGRWIIWYFFLGGLAAGTYFVATLIELMGQEADWRLARLGYRLAFPLIGVCGILLIVDLERPERFWHMMLQSEVVHEAVDQGDWGVLRYAAMLKWWSPMSIGALALGLFGAWSSLSFVSTFWNPRIVAWVLARNWIGHAFRLIGCGLGFFVASYTGVLLAATNQPVWMANEWIAPLFLTSAASTSISVLLLLGRGTSPDTRERLEKADLWALGLELFLFLIFLASLGNLLPMVLETWQGWLLVAGTLLVGLLIPLTLHLGLRRGGAARVNAAALSALVGGFLLRFGIVRSAPALLDLFAEYPHAEQIRRLDEVVNAPLYYGGTGVALILLTVVLACAIPMLLRRHWQLSGPRTALACIVSSLAIATVLYYSMQPLAERPTFALRISPEDQRERGGGDGASLFNRPDVIHVRSKLTKDSP